MKVSNIKFYYAALYFICLCEIMTYFSVATLQV